MSTSLSVRRVLRALAWGGLALLVLGASKMPPLVEVDCPQISSPIVVDGVLDDAAWQSAAPISDFRLWDSYKKPSEKTTFRICYDDRFLYAAFECVDPDVFTLYDTRDAYLWESDSVELFLVPDPKNPIYYEFEAAPNNAVFDARMINSGSGGFRRWASWDCGIRTATRIHGTLNNAHDRDEGYTVEMAIPWDAFEDVPGAGPPLKGQTWKFAAVRTDMSVTLAVEERSSTANIPAVDVHTNKKGYSILRFK